MIEIQIIISNDNVLLFRLNEDFKNISYTVDDSLIYISGKDFTIITNKSIPAILMRGVGGEE